MNVKHEPETLTSDYADRELSQETLISASDRTLIRNEWVIAYEEPYGAVYEEFKPDRRGYVTVWLRVGDDAYIREQMLSGDDMCMKKKFAGLAAKDTDYIKWFVDSHDAPQP